MDPENVKVRLHRDIYNGVLNFLIANIDFNGKRTALGKLTMQSIDTNKTYGTEPTFSLTEENAQSLFQMLWDEGFRPSNGAGHAGHIEAVTYHLEDMRKLVFNNIKE